MQEQDTQETVPLEDTYFHNPMYDDSSYFDTDAQRVSLPVGNSSELSWGAVLLSGVRDPEPLDISDIPAMEDNFQLYGSDPKVSQDLSDLRDELRSGMDMVLPDMASDMSVQDVTELVSAYSDAESTVDLIPDRALMNSVLGTDVSASEDADEDFATILGENVVHSTLIDILEDAKSDIELIDIGDSEDNILERYGKYAKSTTNLVLDALELVTVSPITERQFQSRVLDQLGIGSSGNPFKFRAKSLDTLTNWLLEGSEEEMVQKMLDFTEIVRSTESSLGTNNFYGLTLLDNIQMNLETATGGTNWAAADDILDVAAVGDVATIARVLGSRFLGRISARSKGLDAQGYEELEHEVRTFAERVAGATNVRLHAEKLTTIPVRGSKGSLADNLYQHNPELFRSILSRTEAEERIRVIEKMGIPEDDIIVRTYGTPDREAGGMHPSIPTGKTPQLPYSTIRQVQFTDEAQMNAVHRYLRPIVSLSDGALHPQRSSIVQPATESDDLVFRTVFGKDEDKGYSTFNEAEDARMFLLGEQGEVIQEGSEFFIQSDMRTTLLARDANPFPEGAIKLTSIVADYLVPNSARVQRDIFNASSNVADLSTQQSTEFRQLLNPIRELSTRKGEDSQFYYLLNYGDMNETTLTRAEANELLGGSMTDNTWRAYTNTRKAYDMLHQHRNAVEYRRLLNQDMRTINTNGSRGAFMDEDGAVFARPLNSEEGIQEFNRIANGRAEVPVMRNDGTVQNMTAAQVRSLYDEGLFLAKPNRVMKLDDGTSRYHLLAVRSASDVQPLTPTPLTKRPGHIDRRYADPGCIIKGTRVVNIDGVQTSVPETVAVVKNKPEAEAFIARRDNPEDYSYEASREVRASLREELSDEEIDRLQSTLYPPSTRGRGNHLLGANDAPAQLLAPDEVLNQHANELRNTFGKDVIETLKTRWTKTYNPSGRYPANPSGFSDEAKAMHRFITNQENALSGKVTASYFDGMRRLTRELLDSPEGWKRAAGEALEGLSQNYLAAAAKLNTYLFIIGRVGYQVSANLAQQFYLFVQDPVAFSKALPRSMALTAGMVIERTEVAGKDIMMRILGGTFGMDSKDFAKLVRQMHDSGSTNVGMADDFLHLITGATKIQAGASTRQALVNAPMMPFKGLYGMSIKMTNIVNYAQAATQYMTRNPGASIFSTKAKTDIAERARRLGFTQNRADQFAYQQNGFILPLQFMQHVHKMFFQTTLDPLFKMATGRNIGQQGVNVFAETRAKALTTFLMSASAFGLTSYVPEEATDPVRNAMRDMQNLPPELQTVILDGWFNLISEKMFGEQFNWGDRFSGNSFVRSFIEMHSDSNFLELTMGPTGSSLAYMREVIQFTSQFKDTPIIDENRYREITGPMVEMFAGARDLTKARIVANHGAYVTRNGFQSAEVNPSTAILVGLSLTPSKASTYWSSSEGSPGGVTESQELANHARRWFLRELNVLGDDVTPEQIVDLQRKALDALYIATNQGEGGTPVAYQEARDFFRNGLIQPEDREEGVESQFIARYGNRLMRSARSYKDGIRSLERATEQYPEYEEMLTRLKEYFEITYENLEEGL